MSAAGIGAQGNVGNVRDAGHISKDTNVERGSFKGKGVNKNNRVNYVRSGSVNKGPVIKKKIHTRTVEIAGGKNKKQMGRPNSIKLPDGTKIRENKKVGAISKKTTQTIKSKKITPLKKSDKLVKKNKLSQDKSEKAKDNWRKLREGVRNTNLVSKLEGDRAKGDREKVSAAIDNKKLKALTVKPGTTRSSTNTRRSGPAKPLSKERSERAKANWKKVRAAIDNKKLQTLTVKPGTTRSSTNVKKSAPAKPLSKERSERAKANWKKVRAEIDNKKLKALTVKTGTIRSSTNVKKSAPPTPLSKGQSENAKANWKKVRVAMNNKKLVPTADKSATTRSLKKAKGLNPKSQLSAVENPGKQKAWGKSRKESISKKFEALTASTGLKVKAQWDEGDIEELDHFDQREGEFLKDTKKGKGLLGKIADKLLGDGLSGVIDRVLPKLIDKVNHITEQAGAADEYMNRDVDVLTNEIERLRNEMANKKSENKYGDLINLLLENSGADDRSSIIKLVVVMMLNDDSGLSVENKNALFKILMSDDNPGNNGFVSKINGPAGNDRNFVKSDRKESLIGYKNSDKNDLIMKLLEISGHLN